MPFQGGLDLGGVDVHAAGDDHVVLAVADEVVALLVPVGDVTHGVEVAVHGGPVAFRLLVVLAENPGGPDVELAGMPGAGSSDLVAVGVEQGDLDTGGRPAARPGLAQLVPGLQDAVHPELGRSVDLPERVRREVGQVGLLEREAPRRGVGQHDPHRRPVVAGLDLGGQRAHEPDRRRRAERGGDPVLVHEAQPVLRLELPLDDDRLAERERGAHERQRAAVIQRPGGEVDVVLRIADEADQRDRRALVGRPAVGALRLAGRPGGVDHRRAGAPGLPGRGLGRCPGDEVLAEHPGRGGATVGQHMTQVAGVPVVGGRDQVRVPRIDVGGAGVGMDHDIAGFRGRQAVVQRNRDRPELPGRVDDRHDLRRVGPAPDDFLTRAHAQRAERVGQPVRLRLELSEAPRDDVRTWPVIDDGRLAGLR